MSKDIQQIERDDATSIFESDPILGKYVSHHPSNRLRLMIISGVIYTFAVGIIQLVFWTVDDSLASIFIPLLFAGVAGAVLWYMLHHWNREVVLYERGFSFRQGSSTAYILYVNVIKLFPNIKKNNFLGFSWIVYDYKLVTDVDETLSLNNVYSNIDKLTRTLEAFVTRDRLPILRHKMQDGTAIPFSDSLSLSRDGIMLDSNVLFWQEFIGKSVKNGQIILQSIHEDTWASIPVSELDNAVLFLALLKEQRHKPEITQ